MVYNPANTNIKWHVYKVSIIIHTKNTHTIVHKGDFITYEERDGTGVLVEEFTGSDLEGPIGLIYKPWRETENRWASVQFSIARGNLRHLICYPVGIPHYGLHINWESVRIINEKKPNTAINYN
jgi:hypothetical protein